MTPALALQGLLRARLTTDATMLALVPAAHILDAHGRPSVFPCIMLGEAQEVPADEVANRYFDVFSTLHVWHREPGTTGVKEIAGAIRRALQHRPWPMPGMLCHDLRFEGARYMRDPNGEVAHGVVTIAAVIEELAS